MKRRRVEASERRGLSATQRGRGGVRPVYTHDGRGGACSWTMEARRARAICTVPSRVSGLRVAMRACHVCDTAYHSTATGHGGWGLCMWRQKCDMASVHSTSLQVACVTCYNLAQIMLSLKTSHPDNTIAHSPSRLDHSHAPAAVLRMPRLARPLALVLELLLLPLPLALALGRAVARPHAVDAVGALKEARDAPRRPRARPRRTHTVVCLLVLVGLTAEVLLKLEELRNASL